MAFKEKRGINSDHKTNQGMKKLTCFFILFFPVFTFSQSWTDLNIKALSAEEHGDYQKAVDYYEAALKIVRRESGKKSADCSIILGNFGLFCAKLGEFEKAEPMLLEALEIRKGVYGLNHPSYATTLGYLGTLYINKGEYTKAETNFLRCLEINKLAFGANSIEYADNLNNLSVLYQILGKYDKVEEFLLQAIEIYKNKRGDSNSQYTVSLANLGILYCEIGEYQKAEEALLKVAEVDKNQLGEKHEEYGHDLINLAALYAEMGDNQQAISLYLQGISICKNAVGEMNPGYATGLNNLACVYNDIGEFEKSEQLFIKCIEIRKQILGEEHEDYAESLSNLASLYDDLGLIEKAEELYVRSLSIRKLVLGENHPNYATCLNNMALLYYKKGMYTESEILYQQAASILKDVLGESDYRYIGALGNLAMLYKRTRQLAKAELIYMELVNTAKQSRGENSLICAIEMHGLASVYHKMGKYKEAEFYYDKSIKNFGSILGSDHPDYAKSLNTLAEFNAEIGNISVAKQLYPQSDSILLAFLHKVFRFTSESEKSNYLATLAPYLECSQSFYTRYFNSEAGISTSALNLHLATSVLILYSVSKLKEAIIAENNDSLLNLYNKLENLNLSISKEFSKPHLSRDPNLDYWLTQANTLEKELNRLSQSFKGASGITQPSFKSIRENLQPHEVAVEFISFNYFNGKDWTDSTLYNAIIIRPDDSIPIYIPLFEEKQITGLLKADSLRTYANLLYTNAQVRDVEHEISYGDSLFQLVWKPLEPWLGKATRIFYSPTGLLHKISFEAIPMRETFTLSDKYEMDRLITTGKVSTQTTDEFMPTSVSLFGGIQYDITTHTQKYAAVDSVYTTSNYAQYILDTTSRSGLNYLPGSKKEVQKIQGIFSKSKIESNVYMDQDATEEKVKNWRLTNSPSVLHFSTHGFFFPDPDMNYNDQTDDMANMAAFKLADNPLFRSGIMLSGANYVWTGNHPLPNVEDGILTAYEVSNLYLPNTELVVLSACETGLGDIKGTEGVYGLQRAFKMAGVNYIIMSLWQVLDKETSEFMILFYEKLLEKKSIPDAFKVTQNIMKNKYRDEPYKWAGFVLIR
jgi:tetratricopeptide (TPR) repeat protein